MTYFVALQFWSAFLFLPQQNIKKIRNETHSWVHSFDDLKSDVHLQPLHFGICSNIIPKLFTFFVIIFLTFNHYFTYTFSTTNLPNNV